jgi:hypothetical protein
VSTADLSRRLAACPRFRWLPGMANTNGDRCLGECSDGLLWCDASGNAYSIAEPDYRPDLDDPATLGALEFGLLAGLGGKLRRVPGDWVLSKKGHPYDFVMRAAGEPVSADDRTHALVLALESYGAEGSEQVEPWTLTEGQLSLTLTKSEAPNTWVMTAEGRGTAESASLRAGTLAEAKAAAEVVLCYRVADRFKFSRTPVPPDEWAELQELARLAGALRDGAEVSP